ncbi:MAG: RraA family protein [Melioribacteraceae bacterium]|jgi:regulator of RNase E activity RraA|nr:RraA family protein [Melioribacteraceae bacterium]
MKNYLMIIVTFILLGNYVSAQVSKVELQKGYNYITTKIYSEQEDSDLLKLYEGLRVADVSDGMDMVGLANTGLVSTDIYPDWVDTKEMSHQFRGIAITVRYVPTQKPDRPAPGQKFQEWEGNFYNAYSHEAFAELIKPGTAVIIDDVEDKDIGSIGSYNILDWFKRGAVGVVTDASSRDTDEIALQKIPLYLRKKGRGIRPGRNEIESVNRPVTIGGVLVCPGDVVVADGDGVIVVPRNVAPQVAEFARQILNKDKAGRKNLYEQLERPLDKTVK